MGPAAPAGCEATHTIVGAADVALVFVAESSAVTLVKKLTTFFSPNTKSRAAPYLFLHPAFLLCLSHLMVRDRDDLLAAVSKLAAAFPTATLEELLPDHVMVAQLLKIEYEGKIQLEYTLYGTSISLYKYLHTYIYIYYTASFRVTGSGSTRLFTHTIQSSRRSPAFCFCFFVF